MPEHTTYIETHLGAGAMMRTKVPAWRQIGIHIDTIVVAGWRIANPDVPCEAVCAEAIDFLLSLPFTGDDLVYRHPADVERYD